MRPDAKYWFPSGLIPSGWTGIEFAAPDNMSLDARTAALSARGAGVSRCMAGVLAGVLGCVPKDSDPMCLC